MFGVRRGMMWPEFHALHIDEQLALITGAPVAAVMEARLAKKDGAALLLLAIECVDERPQEAAAAIKELDRRVGRFDKFRRRAGGCLGQACCALTRDALAGNYIACLMVDYTEDTRDALCKMGELVAFVYEHADEIQYRPSGALHAALIFEIFGLPRFMPDAGDFGPFVEKEVTRQRISSLMCHELLED
jgi:hypothetical protein